MKIVKTKDGSHTLYVPELNEHYHSIHGALQESEHIFIKSGFDFVAANPVRIFEVGFGTGLNAYLTALRCLEGKREVFYTSIEKYPLDDDIVKELNYTRLAGKERPEIFRSIHSSAWGSAQKIIANFTLTKINADLTSSEPGGQFDIIYFDAFGPGKQPEMWTPDIMKKMSAVAAPGCVLVTYSVKGDVKRNLLKAGFEVNLLPGPPGKRHILRAIKI